MKPLMCARDEDRSIPRPLRPLGRSLLPALLLLAMLSAVASAGDDGGGGTFFESKIRPVLVERCQECHSTRLKKPKGNLSLDTREGIRKGGNSGPAVVPGDLESSVLFQATAGADG